MSDRTLSQVQALLRALNCTSYEVQPLAPKGVDLPIERIRRFSAPQIEKSITFLKKMNRDGYDIYIRPGVLDNEIAYPFAFVDDLSTDDIARMKADGFPFAICVESSPGNHHGWVRLSAEPLPRAVVSQSAKMLAQKYDADLRSFDWRHYGRLPGYANRKPSRARPSGPPWVTLKEASRNVAPGAPGLVELARQVIEQQRHDRKERLRAAVRTSISLAMFAAAWDEARPRDPSDLSARDFAAVLSLLRRGYAADDVAAALNELSPDIAERHANVEDYVSRTVGKAQTIISATPCVPAAPGR